MVFRWASKCSKETGGVCAGTGLSENGGGNQYSMFSKSSEGAVSGLVATLLISTSMAITATANITARIRCTNFNMCPSD